MLESDRQVGTIQIYAGKTVHELGECSYDNALLKTTQITLQFCTYLRQARALRENPTLTGKMPWYPGITVKEDDAPE